MKTRSKLVGRLLCLALCLCMVLAIPLVAEAADTCEHVDVAKEDGRCDVCGCLMQDVYLGYITASLEGNIAVNYFMLLSDEVLADETAYMQFTMADGEIIKVPVSESKLIDGYDVFTCEVAAKEMTDIITSQFYYGGEVALEHPYNVRAYAKHIIQNSDDANAKALMEAMVNYGAASQLHFGYNKEDLADDVRDKEGNLLVTVPDYENIHINEFPFTRGQGTEKVKLYSASLILNSETTLRLFFNGKISATYNNKKLDVKQRSGLYYVDIVDIAAKELDDDVTITINDGTESANIVFSPMSYCQIVEQDASGAYDTEMKNLVRALYLYNKAADEYFGDAVTEPQGTNMLSALHYMNGNGTQITSQVNSVTFGRSRDYRNIIRENTGILMDEEQDTPAYVYYILNGEKYDLYFLSNDAIYAPANVPGLFKGMTNLTAVETGNFNVSRVKEMKQWFRECGKLSVLNVTGWDTSNVTFMGQLFYKCGALKTIPGIEKWNTSAVTSLRGMFRQSGIAGDLDLSAWNVSKVTDMQQMFYAAPNIANFKAVGWNTGACTDMSYLFTQCSNLRTVNAAGWNTSEVTTMYSMFANCGKLVSLDATGWTNSKVTNAINMFMENASLTGITGSGGWNFASATGMECFFQNCISLTQLDVTNWDMSKAETVWNLFAGCSNLVTLTGEENWKLSSATTTNYMFQNCISLTQLDVTNWDMSNVTTMSAMFQGCGDLEYLDLSQWKTGNCQYFNSAFSNCYALKLDKNALVNWNMSSALRINHMFDGATSVEALNLSGWNMPNLITTTHMFADCSNLKSIDFTDWNTPNLVSLDCMFNDCTSLTYLNVSSFDTATVKEFSQIFERCTKLEKIDGLEKWDTSNGLTFGEAFRECYALKELDLTTFNTRNVIDQYFMEWQPDPKDPNMGEGCRDMFYGTNRLEKLVLGANFSFDGDGKVTTASYKISLPAPNNAEGVWYDEEGKPYAPSDIPQETVGTYYAVNPVQP